MKRLLMMTMLIISCNAFSNGYDDYQNHQYQQDMLRQQQEQMRQQQEQNAQRQMQEQVEYEANRYRFRGNNNL